jgi:hypothetical protein
LNGADLVSLLILYRIWSIGRMPLSRQISGPKKLGVLRNLGRMNVAKSKT